MTREKNEHRKMNREQTGTEKNRHKDGKEEQTGTERDTKMERRADREEQTHTERTYTNLKRRTNYTRITEHRPDRRHTLILKLKLLLNY